VYRAVTISRIVLIPVLLLAACGSTTGAGGRTTVVASFYPLAYAAQEIGGPAVDVENSTPPGSEPHDLELTPQAVARISRANIVLYLGHGFQPAVSDAVRNVSGRAIDVLSGLPLQATAGQEPGVSADPHVWLDPALFERIVRRIGSVLHRRAAAARLERKLDAVDREYRNGLERCRRKDIVTSHAAFGYLAGRYGLHQVPITGLAPESEPSPKRLADVVQLVRKTRATTVFFETLVSPRLAKTVAREVGARTAVLDPIEGLTPAEQSHGDTYLTLMRRNLAALRKGLGCR
jgi:zinc transport system substrate-binding protein